MDIKNIQKITVDFYNNKISFIRAKQYDKKTRYLIVSCTNNGTFIKFNPEDTICNLKMLTPDNRAIYNEEVINEDGTILVEFTESMLCGAGKGKFELNMLSKDYSTLISTMTIDIIIEPSVYDNDKVISSDEYNILNKIIIDGKKLILDLTTLETTLEENEEDRQRNEEDRQRNENVRKSNETARQSQETSRENAENLRESNTATAIANAEAATKRANDATDDLQAKLDAHHFVLTEDKDIAGGVPSLDSNTKVPIAELYEATTTSKGITQLTDSVTSTSITTAATPNSVKSVKDSLNSEISRAKSAESTLTTNLNNEITRATDAESTLTTNLNTEITRAKSAEALKAPLASPTLTGTPTAPTATAGTNTTQIATTAFVQTAVSDGIAASDALIFKGTLGTSGTITALPTTYKTGWTYRVITVGTYAGQVCEIGDLIVALVDRSDSGNLDADWCVAQTNINGAITGIKSGDAYITTSQSGSVVTIAHKDVIRTNTTSTASPSSGGTFTTVDSVTSDSKGHITSVNTKTIILPTTVGTISLIGDVIGSGTFNGSGSLDIKTTVTNGGHYIGTSSPSNTNLLWIDTSNSGILKYYDGTTWVEIAGSAEILDSMQSYLTRAQALYDSMYLDCDGETPNLRVVTLIKIKGGTPQQRLIDGGISFDGGTPTSRLLGA